SADSIVISLLTSLLATNPTLFPYTTLFRSYGDERERLLAGQVHHRAREGRRYHRQLHARLQTGRGGRGEAVHELRRVQKILRRRSEEHTSELQSPYDLVCRLLLEKKNENNI